MQNVEATRNVGKTSVRGEGLFVAAERAHRQSETEYGEVGRDAQLSNVAEEERRSKVAFDVSLQNFWSAPLESF